MEINFTLHMKNKRKKIIIIGAGIGGLSIAPLLSKENFDVEIFESEENVGGRANIISENGFTFDTGPSLLNYPWVYEDYFNSLGKNFYDYVELIKVDPAVNFLWKDQTNFQLSSDINILSDEISKFSEKDRSGIIDFFKSSQKKYDLAFKKIVTKNSTNVFNWLLNAGIKNILSLGLTNSMYSEINKFFEEKKIVEALSSYSMYLGDSPYKLPGFFSILPYGELQYGLWMPKGGMYGLVKGLKKLNEDFDVKINTSSKIKKIIVEKNKAVGIEINDEKKYADLIVSNVDSETTYKNLIGLSTAGHKMTPSVYTYYWGINKSIDSLTHHTIFLPDNFKKTFDQLFIENKIPDDLPFYISIPSKTDPDLAPRGKSSLFVLIPCPTISTYNENHSIEKAHDLKEKVFRRFKQNNIDIKKDDIVYEKIYTPSDWKNKFGLFDGSAFGPSHNFTQIGPFRNPNKSKQIKNLYFVGASTTPGTGVPMCVLSSKMTKEKITEDSKS